MRRIVPFPRLVGLPAALFLAVAALGGTASGEEVLTNSSKECAICHIRWVQALDRSHPPESSMQAVMDRQTGSGDMCLSCHDGSVVDSRFKVWSTRHHATDVVPSPAVHIPTDKFPLDAQGRMTCATCHTAHAVAGDSDLRTVIFLRQPNIDSSLCLACHPQHAQKNDYQHPLGRGKTPVPKVILDAGGKTSPDGYAIICQTCHEPHGARNAWMLVLPPAELCIACHTEKTPEISAPAGAPMHRIGRTYTGFKPPATLLSEKATFGPNGELSCLSCHRLHDASGARPLLIRKNENSSLCLECHPKKKAVLGSPHDLRVSSPETANAHGEKPPVSGPCGACHRVHGWARDVPETNRPHSSGCMECHQPGGPGARKRPYVEAHPVGVPVPEGMSPPLPLDAASRDIGCLTCHDPHTPRPPEALAQEKIASPELGRDPTSPAGPVAPSAAPTSDFMFLRREASQLCVLCHEKRADCLHGDHDPTGFAPSLREALGVQPAAGTCRTCHTAHNAQGPHLWTRAPADTPAGPTSNLCLACHDGTLPKNPQGTNHPLSTSDSGLQRVDGGLRKTDDASPQSAIHNPPSVEVSCTSCHDPHGGVQPAKLLPGLLDSLCCKCHEEKQSIKGSVHDPSANEWAGKLGFVPRALCLDCHPIHGPRQQAGIWPSLGGASAPENLCEGCHRPGMPGSAVATPHAGKTLPHAPADPAGARAAHPDQQIRCGTCHDIHQNGQAPKLLRAARDDSSLCLTCHADLGGILDTSHDLRKSAPTAQNVRGETATVSGPCGACHRVHPDLLGGEIWAQHRPRAGDHGQGLCAGCHGPGGCAAGRVPGRVDHPDVPLLNRTAPGQPDYMPTFDDRGQPSPTGTISCPTCHQVHSPPAGSTAHEVGSPSPWMFLRVAHQRLCTDCHGAEALWRFLFYHKANRNPRGRN
jgi:predicted CXXCH cytochrome family protein